MSSKINVRYDLAPVGQHTYWLEQPKPGEAVRVNGLDDAAHLAWEMGFSEGDELDVHIVRRLPDVKIRLAASENGARTFDYVGPRLDKLDEQFTERSALLLAANLCESRARTLACQHMVTEAVYAECRQYREASMRLRELATKRGGE